MIFNYDLEKQLLAALIKEPDSYADVAEFIDISDFYSEDSNLHSTIFTVIKQAIQGGDEIDEVIIAQRVAQIGAKFEDDVDPSEYIRSLAFRKVPKGNLVKTARELKRISIRRVLFNVGGDIARKMRAIKPEQSYTEIVSEADAIYNKQVNLFEVGQDQPVNIYDEMEDWIEERGENPVTEFGMMGPHPKINEMYGSLLRPGNITVVVARSGVGKTQFCMHYATKVSQQYDVPVLHFDNGEMSKEELIIRQCALLSGVPAHLLETGKWRRAGQEIVDKVRAVWPIVKKIKFFYYNVGGMDVDSMVNTLKRFYYSKIGRGNKMVFSFDYIKTTSEDSSGKNEWQVVGEMVDKFKKCIQKEILHNDEPIIPMITSVQANRLGITTNRDSDSIIDNESIASLSDRIMHFCSHMFILRAKTADEMLEEGVRFGTHKFIKVKARHLGEDIAGATEMIQVGDALRNNFVNMRFANFNITECGDLRDIVRGSEEEIESNDGDDTPDLEGLRSD